ncbi:MAG: ABC transporter permease subunit [Candidatus Thorarchaeota archaeon]
MTEKSSDVYVRRFSFRPYEGTRRGRLYRIWSISWYWWKHQWDRSRAVKILFGFLMFTLILTNMFILATKDLVLSTNPLTGMAFLTPMELMENTLLSLVRGIVTFQTTFSSDNGNGNGNGPFASASFTVGGTSIFILILLVLIGAGLIADDISNQTNEIYYSKLEKYEYVIGKFGAFVIFGNIALVLPYIIEFFLLYMGIGGIDFVEALPLLLHVIIFTEIITITYAAMILAFSSLTKRRLYSGLAAFMLLFIISMIIPPLAFGESGEEGLQLLLDILTVLLLTSYILKGATTVEYASFEGSYTLNLADGIGIDSWMVLGALGLYILVGLLIVIIQVYRRHSR